MLLKNKSQFLKKKLITYINTFEIQLNYAIEKND